MKCSLSLHFVLYFKLWNWTGVYFCFCSFVPWKLKWTSRAEHSRKLAKGYVENTWMEWNHLQFFPPFQCLSIYETYWMCWSSFLKATRESMRLQRILFDVKYFLGIFVLWVVSRYCKMFLLILRNVFQVKRQTSIDVKGKTSYQITTTTEYTGETVRQPTLTPVYILYLHWAQVFQLNFSWSMSAIAI